MSCSRERGHDHGSYLFISFLHMLFSSHSSSSSSSYSYSSSSSLFHLSLSLSPSLHLHLRQIVSPNPSSFSFVVLRFPYPYFLLVAVARHEVAQSYISDVFFFSSLLFSSLHFLSLFHIFIFPFMSSIFSALFISLNFVDFADYYRDSQSYISQREDWIGSLRSIQEYPEICFSREKLFFSWHNLFWINVRFLGICKQKWKSFLFCTSRWRKSSSSYQILPC